MAQQFEWDKPKAAANLKKHGVSFDEALTMFADPLARIRDDPDHSIVERREIIIGLSVRHRTLVVGFTEREPGFGLSVLGEQRHMNGRTMKKVKSRRVIDELRPEYNFSASETRPNRFASRMEAPVVAVILEPDVAAVFDSSKAVNKALRSVISTLPKRSRAKKAKSSQRKAG